MKWFCYYQNNSGGYFVTDEKVAAFVFIQANNADEANTKFAIISEESSYDWCECCGPRWDCDCEESDGTDEPMIFGEPFNKYEEGLRESAIFYHEDGSSDLFVFGENV